MHRVLTLALLSLMPMLELQAQRGHDREDRDSTESTVVRGIAVFGGIGFSLLRLALNRPDAVDAQSLYCLTACNGVSRAAALHLSDGPDGWRSHSSWEPLGERIANAIEHRRGEQAETKGRRFADVDQPSNALDHLQFEEPAVTARKGLPLPELPPPTSLVPNFDQGCFLHTCSSDVTLLNTPPRSVGPEDWPSGVHINGNVPVGDISELLDQEQIGTIVNPEPSTWALMAAGLLGLVAASRRKR